MPALLDVGADVIALNATATARAPDLRHIHAKLARKRTDRRAGIRHVTGHHDGRIERWSGAGVHVTLGNIIGRLTAGTFRRMFLDRRCRSGGCRGNGCGSRSRCRCGRGGGGAGGCSGSGLHLDHHDDGTFGHSVAHFQFHFLHRAGKWRGDFHGRLVRLQRDQPLFPVNVIADLDHHFNHGNIGVADIGNQHLFEVGHGDSCNGMGTLTGEGSGGIGTCRTSSRARTAAPRHATFCRHARLRPARDDTRVIAAPAPSRPS